MALSVNGAFDEFMRVCVNIDSKLSSAARASRDNLLSNINGYSLDKEQRKAIITDEDNMLVLAGAGSGKTLTIVGKIRYLIERKNFKSFHLLLIYIII